MTFVLLRLSKVVVVFALVSTLCAHWALLQTVAWTTMLADNLQSFSLRTAMMRTFDGDHPCCLCKAIAAAKKSQQKDQFSVQKQKLDFTPTEDAVALIAPSQFNPFAPADSCAESFFQKPPTPPPRSFSV